jgi:hypothetical protein
VNGVPSLATVIWVAIGVIGAIVVWKVGIALLRAVSQPPPPPPPPGEMRRINVRYRCQICGVELRMTLAPDEDPPPPRHCLEDMVEIAPLYD